MAEPPAGSTTLPVIKVKLALAAELAAWAEPGPPRDRLRREITADLNDLLRELGIPGRVSLGIGPLGPGVREEGRWLALRIRNAACRYPDELLCQIWSAVGDRTVLKVARSPGEVAGRLRAPAACDDDGERRRVTNFLRLACLGIAKLRPSSLLGRAQAEAYRRALVSGPPGIGVSPPETGWLRDVLADVLELRLSIADTAAVGDALGKALREGKPREEAAEDLIAALRRYRPIEIRVRPEYLEALTVGAEGGGAAADQPFASVRKTLSYELGLGFPDIRFVPTEDVGDRSVVFRVNDLTTAPWWPWHRTKSSWTSRPPTLPHSASMFAVARSTRMTSAMQASSAPGTGPAPRRPALGRLGR